MPRKSRLNLSIAVILIALVAVFGLYADLHLQQKAGRISPYSMSTTSMDAWKHSFPQTGLTRSAA
jgi:hypothetical protein